MRQFDRPGRPSTTESHSRQIRPPSRHLHHGQLQTQRQLRLQRHVGFLVGNTGTLAMHEYVDPETGQTVSYIESRNNYRLPPYHRLDVGLNWHTLHKDLKTFDSEPVPTISSNFKIFLRFFYYIIYI